MTLAYLAPRSLRARRPFVISDFVSVLGFQAVRACTKHLSGLGVGDAFVPVSQKLVGSLARPFKVDLAYGPVVSGLEKSGRAPRRNAHRRRAKIRRGGGSPIKTSGCRARSGRPVGVSRLGLRPCLSIEKQAPVGRLDHPPPLLQAVPACRAGRCSRGGAISPRGTVRVRRTRRPAAPGWRRPRSADAGGLAVVPSLRSAGAPFGPSSPPLASSR